ncbi:MAG: hypothetical protein U0M47_03905 [Merdibacter sp.]|nr:hypothetical protein [Merdibacter sp.]HIY90601.1 hypothetical protein [Candidatus Merdibacter merdipullorum]
MHIYHQGIHAQGSGDALADAMGTLMHAVCARKGRGCVRAGAKGEKRT